MATETVVSGMEALGKANSMKNAVIGVSIGLVVCSVASVLLYLPDTRTEQVESTVTRSDCTIVKDSKGVDHQHCKVNVTYPFKDTNYSTVLNDNINQPVGAKLKLIIDPNSPTSVNYNEIPRNYIAYGSMGLATLTMIVVLLNLYLTMNNKTYAAFEGASTTVNAITNTFRKR